VDELSQEVRRSETQRPRRILGHAFSLFSVAPLHNQFGVALYGDKRLNLLVEVTSSEPPRNALAIAPELRAIRQLIPTTNFRLCGRFRAALTKKRPPGKISCLVEWVGST